MGEGATFLLFLGCSIAMFTLPFVAFFGVRDVLRNEFDFDGFAPTAWGVLAAVVVVNVIIIFYAYRAYREEAKEELEEAAAEREKTD